MKLVALILLCVFYCAYIMKSIQQKRRGIVTDQLGKGSKSRALFFTETSLKCASYLMVVVPVISIIRETFVISVWFQLMGLIIASLGIFFFISGMLTMRDSWRAGIPTDDKTNLVTTGIYRFSRNPAFLGFDLLYIGIFLAYPNIIHFVVLSLTIILFDLQIRQEEKYLEIAFGDEYRQYVNHVRRYLGRKKS